MKRKCNVLVVIDGLGEQSFAYRFPDMPVDIVIAPYVGASDLKCVPWCTLAGPEYAILANEYQGLDEREIRTDANRVLVSCGGSDPSEVSKLVIQALNEVNRPLDVRLIIGPLFGDFYTNELGKLADESSQNVSLVRSPRGLLQHMLWTDVAVVTSGLVKYELAATSTPTIMVSIDEMHNDANKPFSALGTVVDLGVNPSKNYISESVCDVLGDYRLRSRMASLGRQVIDGNGALRIVEVLTKISTRLGITWT